MKEHLAFMDGSNFKLLDNPNQFARVGGKWFREQVQWKDVVIDSALSSSFFVRRMNTLKSHQLW